MRGSITDREWETFCAEGYLRLGRTVEERELPRLLERIDAIMLGRAPLDYSRMMMQLDTESGVFTDMGPQTRGHKGATLGYRKITELEFDPLHLRYMQKPLFRHLCARAYGPDTPITCFRAMFMNKPASRGTHLPWHQDVFRQLDRQPRLTAWLALDDATIEKGCLRIIPRSHGQLAHANAESAFPDDVTVYRLLEEAGPVHLEVKAGEAILLHNWLVHTSDVNKTGKPRRAFSVCYMDAATRSASEEVFPVIFGEGALRPEAV